MKNDKLEFILQKYPDARENDQVMYIHYLQEYFCETDLEKQVIHEVLIQAPICSSLDRVRRFYQNELWLYLPPEWVINRRKIAQQCIKEKIRESKRSLFDWIKRWFINNK